jgi:hypothetical protein
MRVFIPSVLAAIRSLSVQSSGIKTLTAGGANIAALSLGLLVPGQLVFVSATALVVKGATGGPTFFQLQKGAGLATLQWGANLTVLNVGVPSHLAGTSWNAQVMAMGRVTVGGDYTLSFDGVSQGSDSTIANGLATVDARIIVR